MKLRLGFIVSIAAALVLTCPTPGEAAKPVHDLRGFDDRKEIS